MKFKKTSVIGVILSLALVLAVTAAFASEPKEPDAPGTLVVDGVTLTGDAAKYASQLHFGMTRGEVHQLLGEPHNFLSGLYGDTYLLERLQGLPVTEPATEAPLFIIYYDNEDFHGGVSKVERVVYRVGDGRYVDLVPAAASEDQPTCVDPDSSADLSLREALEAAWRDRIEAVIKDALDAGKTVTDYDVKLPSFDEDGDPVPIPPAGPEPTVPVNASCGVEGCTETRYHQHSGGYCFLLSDPCPVEGCTIRGSHEHNGVVYSCNGAGHDNGVCDGSCLVYSQPMQTATNAATPQSGSTSGHHSESHHGNGHH